MLHEPFNDILQMVFSNTIKFFHIYHSLEFSLGSGMRHDPFRAISGTDIGAGPDLCVFMTGILRYLISFDVETHSSVWHAGLLRCSYFIYLTRIGSTLLDHSISIDTQKHPSYMSPTNYPISVLRSDSQTPFLL